MQLEKRLQIYYHVLFSTNTHTLSKQQQIEDCFLWPMVNKQNEAERKANSCSNSGGLGREREGLGERCWVFFPLSYISVNPCRNVMSTSKPAVTMGVLALHTKVAVPSFPSTPWWSNRQGLCQGKGPSGQARRQQQPPCPAKALCPMRTDAENLNWIPLSSACLV